jgi:toxin ParE1/3/4
MTLVWSPESIHDLLALRAHIAEHDPAAAKRVALHVLYCLEHLLAENPKLGAPGRVPGIRELVIPKTPYIIPYRVRGSRIEIARSTTALAAGPTAFMFFRNSQRKRPAQRRSPRQVRTLRPQSRHCRRP